MPPEESTSYKVARPSFQPKVEAARAAPADRRERVAVFVAHGMGQQIRFQTLDQIALGLRRQHPDWQEGKPESVPGVAQTIQADDDKTQIQRLELKLKRRDGKEHDVHVYEGYWAPLTEGRVTLRDAMRLLFNGGRNGLNLSLGRFRRWLFGKFESFPVPIATVLYLAWALAVVVSLALINAIVVLAAVAFLPLVNRPDWLMPLFTDLSTTFNLIVTWIALFVITLAVGKALRWFKVPPKVRLIWTLFTAVFFAATLFIITLAGLAVSLLTYGHMTSSNDALWLSSQEINNFNASFGIWSIRVLVGGAILYIGWKIVQLITAFFWDLLKGRGRSLWTGTVMVVSIAMVWGIGGVVYALSDKVTNNGVLEMAQRSVSWPLLVVISAFIRRFLIQYLGDVAVYVTPHTLDRFFDLRSEIRQTVRATLQAVYKREEDGRPYDKIVVVGHSLGSVIVYDALNSMINEDILGGGTLDVVRRTPLLLTFGSPLDKIAFLFALQKNKTSEAREALVAAVQPLLQSWSLRPARWINIYSPWDIIGGALGFYDPPQDKNSPPSPPHPKAVCNLIDPEATTLLAAHTEYWDDPMLYEILFEEVTRESGEEPPGCDHWRKPTTPAAFG